MPEAKPTPGRFFAGRQGDAFAAASARLMTRCQVSPSALACAALEVGPGRFWPMPVALMEPLRRLCWLASAKYGSGASGAPIRNQCRGAAHRQQRHPIASGESGFPAGDHPVQLRRIAQVAPSCTLATFTDFAPPP